MRPLFVTGIGTGIGKTVVSAIVTAALDAEYWKPVQAGDLDSTDTMKVAEWIGAPERCHPEGWRLNVPASPHAAAELDGVHVDLAKLEPPSSARPLVIEGAGGLLVPLDDETLIVDAIERWSAAAIVVSRHYLGSINHTLLTLEAPERRGIEIAGIVFNGDPHRTTEEAILRRYEIPQLFRLSPEASLTRDVIGRYAAGLRERTDILSEWRGQ